MATDPFSLGDSVVVRGDDRDDSIDVIFEDRSGEPVGMEVTVSMDRETAVDFADWIVDDETDDGTTPARETTHWG